MAKERCKGRVSTDGWHFYQCSFNAWKDNYCKRHHPDKVAKRIKKQEDLYLKTRYKKTKNTALYFLEEMATKDDLRKIIKIAEEKLNG